VKFSLVVSTLNRTTELASLLASLDAQLFRDFELIIVDQNSDDRLRPVIARYQDRLPIRRLRSGPGVSRGRNVGIGASCGEIIAFPDDDCLYQPDVLARVAAWMERHSHFDVLTVRGSSESHWPTEAARVTKYNVWKRGIEYAMFFRRGVVDRIGGFDESIGPGAKSRWAAGEGTDYLLRALAEKFQIYFEPAIVIDHPHPHRSWEAKYDRSYAYGLGKGHVLRRRGCPLWFIAYQFLRPACHATARLISGQPRRARNYWAAARGICAGWMSTRADAARHATAVSPRAIQRSPRPLAPQTDHA